MQVLIGWVLAALVCGRCGCLQQTVAPVVVAEAQLAGLDQDFAGLEEVNPYGKEHEVTTKAKRFLRHAIDSRLRIINDMPERYNPMSVQVPTRTESVANYEYPQVMVFSKVARRYDPMKNAPTRTHLMFEQYPTRTQNIFHQERNHAIEHNEPNFPDDQYSRVGGSNGIVDSAQRDVDVVIYHQPAFRQAQHSKMNMLNELVKNYEPVKHDSTVEFPIYGNAQNPQRKVPYRIGKVYEPTSNNNIIKPKPVYHQAQHTRVKASSVMLKRFEPIRNDPIERSQPIDPQNLHTRIFNRYEPKTYAVVMHDQPIFHQAQQTVARPNGNLNNYPPVSKSILMNAQPVFQKSEYTQRVPYTKLGSYEPVSEVTNKGPDNEMLGRRNLADVFSNMPSIFTQAPPRLRMTIDGDEGLMPESDISAFLNPIIRQPPRPPSCIICEDYHEDGTLFYFWVHFEGFKFKLKSSIEFNFIPVQCSLEFADASQSDTGKPQFQVKLEFEDYTKYKGQLKRIFMGMKFHISVNNKKKWYKLPETLLMSINEVKDQNRNFQEYYMSVSSEKEYAFSKVHKFYGFRLRKAVTLDPEEADVSLKAQLFMFSFGPSPAQGLPKLSHCKTLPTGEKHKNLRFGPEEEVTEKHHHREGLGRFFWMWIVLGVLALCCVLVFWHLIRCRKKKMKLCCRQVTSRAVEVGSCARCRPRMSMCFFNWCRGRNSGALELAKDESTREEERSRTSA